MTRLRTFTLLLLTGLVLFGQQKTPVHGIHDPQSHSKKKPRSKDMEQFGQLSKLGWQQVFHDPCTRDWTKLWTLDGRKARITHSEKGMDYFSGPTRKEDASHAVMWTKESFKGDIRLDYEFTKLDDVVEAVTILYLQATGSELGGHDRDIAKWADQRVVASMSQYFKNMNLHHISYAAFDVGNADPVADYIRARRYMPGARKGLRDTDMAPDYFKTGLFKKGVPHKITIIKHGGDLFMHIRNPEREQLCHWRTDKFPPVTEGRIGLRHMWTRGARYRDFRISTFGVE